MSRSALAPQESSRRPLGRLRGSLRRRFVIAIGALVALVLLSLATVLAVTSRRTLRLDMEQRAESHASLAVGPICDAYETYYHSGYSKFRELVSGIMGRNPDLERLAIYEASGERLFSSEELARTFPSTSQPTVLADPALLPALRGLDLVSWRLEEPDGPLRYRVVVPYVEEWGRHRRSVVFDISYASLEAATRAAAMRILWFTVASLGLGISIAVLLARQSLEPLEQLIGGAGEFAEGHLDHRIALDTGDEFELLANTFNDMGRRLAASIADLEASNRALQQSNVELAAMDQLKSDLLANVSHELRTPLTSIKGYAEAMSEGLLGPVTETQREALEVTERNTERLLEMIEELLSYARIESRGLALERGEVDLAALGEEVLGRLEGARPAGLEVELLAEPGLPPVSGDGQRLSQVLENLLANAFKFTPAGGRVELRLARDGSRVRVEVADTGIGIPSGEQARIFDRFYQVESSSTRRFGGIGLGLAIVRQVLDAHGCAVEVESEPGSGTTFRFSLPAASSGAMDAAGAAQVVVVDDDSRFAGRVAEHLEAAGLRVRVAASCRGAEQLVREVRPAAVVLDRLLPDGDGFDLLAKWRRLDLEWRPAVLVVSVRREEALARRLGAEAFLVKPVPPSELFSALRPLLPGSADAQGGNRGVATLPSGPPPLPGSSGEGSVEAKKPS